VCKQHPVVSGGGLQWHSSADLQNERQKVWTCHRRHPSGPGEAGPAVAADGRQAPPTGAQPAHTLDFVQPWLMPCPPVLPTWQFLKKPTATLICASRGSQASIFNTSWGWSLVAITAENFSTCCSTRSWGCSTYVLKARRLLAYNAQHVVATQETGIVKSLHGEALWSWWPWTWQLLSWIQHWLPSGTRVECADPLPSVFASVRAGGRVGELTVITSGPPGPASPWAMEVDW